MFGNFHRLAVFPLDEGFLCSRGGGSDAETHCTLGKNDK